MMTIKKFKNHNIELLNCKKGLFLLGEDLNESAVLCSVNAISGVGNCNQMNL